MKKHRLIICTLAAFSAIPSIGITQGLFGGLFGPSKFTITHTDDRFSTDGSSSVFGMNNLVSRRQLYYVLSEGEGLFLDPAVTSIKEGKLLTIQIRNRCADYSNSGRMACVGRIEEVAFITGEGNPIVLTAKENKTDIGQASYNTVAHYTRVSVSETAYAEISVEDYERVMNAPQLAIKLTGDDKSFVFENKVIDKNFQANLKSFHAQFIAGS